jgi:hypothetical protein
MMEDQKDTAKVSVWCGMMKGRIIGTSFCQEPTVTSHSYLDMLEHDKVP